MIIHQCDICKKEITTWISINVTPDAAYSFTNIGDLINYRGYYELCPKCFKKIIDLM